jgi:hypothetical protein
MLGQIAITTYFNPTHDRARLDNYRAFRDRLEVPLLTVECVFGANEFELEGAGLVHARSNSLLWQKERLLNHAIASLPPQVSIVYLLDADVIFRAPGWADRAGESLEEYQAIQLFGTAYNLDRNGEISGEGMPGFMATLGTGHHGRTGLAWGFRREFLDEIGLYDAMPIGGGDHALAHALAGQPDHPCLDWLIAPEQRSHYLAWAAKVPPIEVGYLGQEIYHLWHGDPANRRYVDRHQILRNHDFNPAHDLSLNRHGAWEWAGGSRRSRLHQDVAGYFRSRSQN